MLRFALAVAACAALVGAAQASIFDKKSPMKAEGFVPPQKHGKLGLVQDSIEPEGRFDWPPIQEPWRCLEQGKGTEGDYHMARWKQVLDELRGPQARDCPLITPDDCEDQEYHALPCNCHAYYQCTVKTTDGPLLPCIYKCTPYTLIFDPNTQNCVNTDQAPPGICADTPPPPPSPWTTLGPTVSTEPATTTTTERTTTSTTTTSTTTTTERTTTSTTTTTTTTTTERTTTAGLPVPCTATGDVFPYPGDCHLYYICLDQDGDGVFEVEIFDCGELVFDPNQGSCFWYEVPPPELCGDGGSHY